MTGLVHPGAADKLQARIDSLQARGKTAEQRYVWSEHGALQALALGAARLGLPEPVLLKKVGPRCFEHVSSADAVGARHALAIAAQVAATDAMTFGEEIGERLALNVQVRLARAPHALCVLAKQHVDAQCRCVHG